MSEYVAYSYEITQPAARQSLAQSFSEGFRDFVAWSSNTWLSTEERESRLQQAYRNSLAAQTGGHLSCSGASVGEAATFASINAMMHSLRETPDLLGHLETVQKREWEALQQDIQPLASVSSHGGYSVHAGSKAKELEERLRTLVSNSHKALAEAEVGFSLKTLAHTLTDLGYEVQSRGHSLRATMGPNCLWGQVSPKAGITLDMSGLSGLQCLKQFQVLEQALEKQGFKLKRRATTTHGRPEGGVLAKELSSHFDSTELRDPFIQREPSGAQKTRKRFTPKLKLRG